jgi:hypothetical protein
MSNFVLLIMMILTFIYSFSQSKTYNFPMQKMFLAACIIAATSTFSPLKAQLLSTATPSTEVTTSNIATDKPEWSLFTDRENSMVYIDFEKINVNLNGLVVKDKEGKVVFKDDALWQLPVNTIYEVDFSKLPKGDYSIELKSFTATLKQDVAIN